MPRLIDANKLDEIRDIINYADYPMNYIDKAPTVDAQPVIHAKWEKEMTIYGWDGCSYQCSKCGRSVHIDTVMEDINIDYPYCHCGAKMDKEIKDGKVD